MAAQLGQRPVQVTVWGASGFTGRLVCEHLVQNYQVGLDEGWWVGEVTGHRTAAAA